MGVPDTYPPAPFFILRNDISGNPLSSISDSATSIDVDIPIESLGWEASNNDMRAYATIREGANVEVVIVSEVVELSAGVSSTWTISRAADGTNNLAFTTAAEINLNANAGLLGQLAGLALPAIVGGYNMHRYGVYGNATTKVHATPVATAAYIHLPDESAEWSQARIMIRNAAVSGYPALNWATSLPIYWSGGSAPAFSATVDYIWVELYHDSDLGRLFGRWWGFDV